MSMVFRFRMLSDENDFFIREYEVPCDLNLAQFNDFICDDMRFDSGGITSFFTSNALWEKEREFTRLDMSAPGPEDDHEVPVPMEKLTLGEIVGHKHDRLIFVFDVFGDRGMFIELVESKKPKEGAEYPCITLSRADPPNQYRAGDGNAFSDEMMSDFDSFEGYGTDGFEDDL